MTVIVDPELGVPIPPDKKHEDLRGYIDAACNTVRELSEHGLEVDTTIEDKDVAAKLALAYAENPEGASKKVTKKKSTLNKKGPLKILM